MYLCGRKQHSSKLPSQLYKSGGRKGLTDFSRANRAREQERNKREGEGSERMVMLMTGISGWHPSLCVVKEMGSITADTRKQ